MKKFLVFFGIFFILGIFSLVLAEDAATVVETPASADSAVTATQEAATKVNNDTQWVWGEVVNLNSLNKAVTLKYLDYEADQEKEIIIKIDDKTSFENIKSFDEIKVSSNLSVDYVVGSQGENIAKNINLEQQDSAAIPETAIVAVPEAAVPVVEPKVESVSSGAAPVAETPAPVTEPAVSQPSAETLPVVNQGQ